MKTVFAAVVCASCACAESTRADTVPDIKAIKVAWSSRQDKARFVSAKWSDLRTVRVATAKGSPSKYSQVKIPVISLLLGSSEGQIRYETEELSSRVGSASVFPFKSAFNGKLATTYSPPRDKYGEGTIKDTFWGRNLFMKAPLLIFRPQWRNLHDLDLSNYHVLPSLQRVDDRLCVVLLEDVGTRFPDLGTTLYLDVQREFLPVKLMETVEGATSSQLSVSYRRDERIGWLPTSWEGSILMPDGQIVEAAKSTVVSIRVNDPVDDSMFVIKFPNGTIVDDVTNNSRHFIAPDGSHKDLSLYGDPDAKGANPERSSRWSVIMVVNVIFLAVVVVAMAVRRRRTGQR